MRKRVLIAGILGGVAMFIWNNIAHLALPLGQAGVHEIVNEGPLLTSMQSTLKQPGLYLFPAMDPKGDQAAYAAKVASGPSGILVYASNRRIAFGPLVGTEFLSELVQAIIAALLLSMTRIASFGGRVGFYAGAGLLAAIGANVSYWNWYAFPASYTLAYMSIIFCGYVFAGMAAAAYLGRSAPKARAVAA